MRTIKIVAVMVRLVISVAFVFLGGMLFSGFADQELLAEKSKPKSKTEAPVGPVVQKFTLRPGHWFRINIRPYVRYGLTQFTCEGPPYIEVFFLERERLVKAMPLEELKRYGGLDLKESFDEIDFYCPLFRLGDEGGEVKVTFFADQKLLAEKPRPKSKTEAPVGPAVVVEKFTLEPGCLVIIDIRPYVRYGLTQFACEGGPPEAEVYFLKREWVIKSMPLEELKRYGGLDLKESFDEIDFYCSLSKEGGEVKVTFTFPSSPTGSRL